MLCCAVLCCAHPDPSPDPNSIITGEAYSTPSDVWALGLSLMTCALGHIPIKADAGYWSLLKCVRDDPPPQVSAVIEGLDWTGLNRTRS